MENILLPNIRLILKDQPILNQIDKGFIIISGDDLGWVDSIVFSVISLMFSRKVETQYLMKDLEEVKYFQKEDRFNESFQKKMNFYGNLSIKENLDSALENAKSELTLGYMKLIRPDGVIPRMSDVLGSDKFDKNIIKCVLSYNV